MLIFIAMNIEPNQRSSKVSKNIKIFIDDIRDPEFINWNANECHIARSSGYAIGFLTFLLDEKSNSIEISFDHDLGENDDAMSVARWLERKAYLGKIQCDIKWNIHSMNPIGATNLKAALTSMDMYIKMHKWIHNSSILKEKS